MVFFFCSGYITVLHLVESPLEMILKDLHRIAPQEMSAGPLKPLYGLIRHAKL
jgi:hypothetical protein